MQFIESPEYATHLRTLADANSAPRKLTWYQKIWALLVSAALALVFVR
jgi:hypothetical protein